MALTGATNEEKIWNFLTGKGLNACGVAGLMGNLYAESALNPKNLQNTYEKKLGYTDDTYTAAVDSGTYQNFAKDSAGYGLAQWTFWSRKEALLAYVKAAGASVGDLETQLGFLYKELSGSYTSVLAVLKTATSVKAASDIVLTGFEKPADQSETVKTKRAGYGQTYYDKYAGSSSATTQTGGNTMSVKIGHSSIDENGKAYGGAAGDQTRKEVCTRDWYANGWTVLLRPKDSAVAEKMAKACEDGCANDKIGYDQYQRNTLRTQAKAVGWDLSKITVACECDCSSFMTVCAEAAGINMDSTYTSGNAPVTSTMRAKFKATGAFEVLTDSKYLTGSSYLKRGDILVKETAHTVMVLSNGANAGSSSGTSTSSGSTSLSFKVGDEVQFTGTSHYTSANATSAKSCKAGKAKVTAVSPSGKHPYHLIAVSGSGSTVYGWVDADKVQAIATASTTGALKVGDVVQFTGTKHYTSAAATTGSATKPGPAKITAISPGAKHPYHVIHTDGTSTVYGWVDAADIGAAASSEIAVGDVVQFAGGPHYTSANATSYKTSPKAGPAKVTAISKGAKHPYHIVHTTSASSVYGWVDADKVSK